MIDVRHFLKIKKNKEKYEKTFSGLLGRLGDFCATHFEDLFKTKTSDNQSKAVEYIQGVLASEYSNLEKLSETTVVGDYHQLQHFISDSPWAHQPVLDHISAASGAQFSSGKAIGLLIDESGVCKKGDHSVGVASQYCGNVGKVENSQVALYSSLCQGDFSTLVDARLYLPKAWTKDPLRCDKAKILAEQRVFKKKTELALEMIDHQRQLGTNFDYIHMDALYGASQPLTDQLAQRGLCFIGDIRSNQRIYLEKPELSVPVPSSKKGRKPTRLKADQPSIGVAQYAKGLKNRNFKRIKVRNTAKGKLKALFHFRTVYIWDGKSEHASQRTLIIRKMATGKRTKQIDYALASADILELGHKEVAQRHAQRFFIEHAFKEAKFILGMSQLQTRKWTAWYHQIALIAFLLLFFLIEKLARATDFPLLSAYDIKQVSKFFLNKNFTQEFLFMIILNRHRKRQADINRYFSNSS